ncbi:MAG: CheR family methyltransferase [Candidatus Thiodiazotropha sp.]
MTSKTLHPKKKIAVSKAPSDTLFPVVAIGASAGGLEAFREVLRHLPADTGMAFVLVQHLDPTHESQLASLLAGSTTMPVHEAVDNMLVEPNHVYIIPPNSNIGILHDHLHLVLRQLEGGLFLPVDWFLRTLAEDHGSRAIGVILSGTASDGTQGLKAIKAGGGVTFAQDEASAEYFGMPGSAIAAGCVDFVLPPREIGLEIGRLARHPYLFHKSSMEELPGPDGHLNKVFLLLRTRTGHDFTFYKHTTIKRRIKRRMLVHKLDRLSDYIRLLEQDSLEVDALFQDMLINVTGFFRDAEVFEALRQEILPKLLDKRPSDSPLRIWVAGCSTGEEAYSLAISLQESLGERAGNFPVQIFASDIDNRAIDQARQGIYSKRIVDEMSPGRLKRFFVKVSGGYQVNKAIRDMCVFAVQNVTKDPPFSKLDLVSCRNLLIYLGASLQKKVLQIFHYALQPSGYLLLGTSETIGAHADLFRLLDKKNKIYTKKSVTLKDQYEFTPRTFFMKETPAAVSQPEVHPKPYSLHQEVEQAVLAKYGPPGVVINSDLEILHFRGETGPYLNPVPGSASLNLLKMARQELAVEMRSAVHKASKEGKSVRKEGVRLHFNGSTKLVDIQVIPINGPTAEGRCLLVLFEEAPSPAGTGERHPAATENVADRNRLDELEQELITSREYLQSIIEEGETTNEELKSANEEIQSTNEELQSTNEELETAKEELQSTNEELSTVNEELENRNIDLGLANNDLTNLLASVNLPILMLGVDLSIRQFTPQAEKLLNLIESDIGRPISQIRANVEIPGLEEIVSEVIETMITRSLEVQDRDGHWYDLRARPYRTLDNRIDGAVITFIDIDDIKDAERLRHIQQSLLETEERLQAILDNSPTMIYLKDDLGHYQFVNRRYAALFAADGGSIVGKTDYDIFPKTYADRFRINDRRVLELGSALEFEETAPHEDGEHSYLSVKFPMLGTDGGVKGVCCISTDISERIRQEQQLQRLATIVRDANDVITMQDFDGVILAWNPAAERLYGWSEAEALTMTVFDILPETEHSAMLDMIRQVRSGETPAPIEMWRTTKTGGTVRVRLRMSQLVDEQGAPRAIATTEQRVGSGDAANRQ